MAFQVKFLFLGICIIVGFLHTSFGSSCYFNSDCTGFGGDYCCGGECTLLSCSETTTCVLNSDCPGATYCCSSGDCRYDLDNCPMPSASIAGIVVGTVILAIIITACIVSCLCCASCPLYHSHRHGGVIVARQPCQTTTVTTSTYASNCYQPPPQTVVPPPQTIAPPPYPGPSFSAYPGNQPSGDPRFSNTNAQYTGVTQYPGPPPTKYP